MPRDERVHRLMQHDKMVKNAADPVPNETPGADTPPRTHRTANVDECFDLGAGGFFTHVSVD